MQHHMEHASHAGVLAIHPVVELPALREQVLRYSASVAHASTLLAAEKR
jgi:hypothetical protein